MISSLQMRRCMQLRVPPANPAGSYTEEIAGGPAKVSSNRSLRGVAQTDRVDAKALAGRRIRHKLTLRATGQRIVT